MVDINELQDEQLSKVSGGIGETIDFELEDRVYNIMSEQTDIPRFKITPNSRLKEDLKLDSLDFIDIIQALEEEFKVNIEKIVFGSLVIAYDVAKYIYGLKYPKI